MKLNSNGKLTQFYMLFKEDGEPLPQDFCTYFWGLVGRIVFTLCIVGIILITLAAGVAHAAIWLWAHKLGAAYLLTFAIACILIVWLSTRTKKIKIEILSEAKAIIKSKVDAVKNRYCPRIEWKD